MLNNKPIKIGILEASPQTKAILEFFFDSSGKTIFKESSLEEASAYIIDYDFPGSKQRWKEQFNKTKKPGIIISINETELESAFWIKKPLTSKDLIEAAGKINAFLENNIVEPIIEQPIMAISDEQKNKQNKPTVKKNNEKPVIQKPAKEEVNTGLAIAGDEGEHESIFDVTDNFEDFSLNPKTETKVETPIAVQDKDPFESNNQTVVSDHYVDLSEPKLDKDVELIEPTSNTADFAISSRLVEVDESTPKTEYNNEALEPTFNTDIEEKEEINEINSLLETLISEEENQDLESVEIIENTSFENTNEDTNEDTNFDSTLLHQNIEENEFNIVLSTIEDDKTLLNTTKEDLSLSDKNIDTNTSKDTSDELSVLIKPNNYLDDDDLIASVNQQVMQQENVGDFEKLEENLSATPENPIEEKTSKPVSPEEDLKNLLEEIRLEAESVTSTAPQSQSLRMNRSSKNITQSRNRPTTPAEERWILTCGNYIRISKNSELKKVSFNPNKHILSAFKDVCQQSKRSNKIVRLKIKGQLFIIDYNRDSIFHDKSIFTDEYAETCQQEVNPTEIKIHGLDSAEERLYQKRVLDEPEYSHTIDSFIWTTSLLISRGRLPKNTDINKRIALKAWPNLTRLEQIPNALQLAAIFSKTPGSLLEISNWINFDQRFVFAFYNAALALDLIEFDSKKMRAIPPNPTKSSKATTQNRGFFSRLLKRIKS